MEQCKHTILKKHMHTYVLAVTHTHTHTHAHTLWHHFRKTAAAALISSVWLVLYLLTTAAAVFRMIFFIVGHRSPCIQFHLCEVSQSDFSIPLAILSHVEP